MSNGRKPQSAYELAYGERARSMDEHVYNAMYTYLRTALGLSEAIAQNRAEAEVANKIGKDFCDECEASGIEFAHKMVLDLGSGLGGLSAEMAQRGAKVLAVEPGSAWRAIAAERLAMAGEGVALGALGEALPVANDSVDLILSLQVLEHVQDPKQVIEEAYRVLKPGGHFLFAYENYLSFWEPHYRVRWLPLLPKRLGAYYLRRLGRDPKFLLEAVTYTTFPAVRRYLFGAGFECTRTEEYRANLKRSEKITPKWRALKAIASLNAELVVRLLAANDYLRRICKTAIYETVRKPAAAR